MKNFCHPPFVKWPSWICPTCQIASIKLIDGTLSKQETGNSMRGKENEGWDVEWIENRYSAAFRCTNADCGEVVISIGDSRVVEHDYVNPMGDWERDYVDSFSPTYFYPALRLFQVPEKCPDRVKVYIVDSFSTVWSNLDGSLSAMRKALEAILTDQKIPRYIIKNKKRISITLHARIDRYKIKNASIGTHIEALKWIGNTGSHDSRVDINLDHVIESYKLLNFVLQQLYNNDLPAVTRISKSIISRKGRPRAKGRKT